MDEGWAEAVRQTNQLLFTCENDHTVIVYSSDPYYPDAVKCQICGGLMRCDQD